MCSRPVHCHEHVLGLYLTYGLSSASMILKQDATRALSTVVTGSFRCLRTKWTASGTMSSHSLPSSSLPSAAPAQQHSFCAHRSELTLKVTLCYSRQVDNFLHAVNVLKVSVAGEQRKEKKILHLAASTQ